MIDRIVQINDLSAAKGGASALAVLAARRLRRAGHNVTYLTGDAEDSAPLMEAGVEIVALNQQRLLASGKGTAMLTGLWNHSAHAMVTEWIARNDTPRTAYHLHGWAQILSPSVFSALEPVRDRLVISAHDFFLACPNGAFSLLKTGAVCPHKPLSVACLTTGCDRNGFLHKAWRSARQVVQRQAYRPSSSPPILTIHSAMREFLMRADIPASSIINLPNPVEPYSHTRIAAERNRQVLFVGRLEETKGPDLAAAAAALAGVPLTIIGEGPLADKIKQSYPLANLVGRRSPDEIRSYAAKARMLVMPSRYPEPFGLVAIEAAWSGLPVILPDTALLSQDLVASGAAIAVEPRNTEGFAAVIRKIASDDARAKDMSEAAFTQTSNLALTPRAWTDRLAMILTQRVAGAAIVPEDQFA